MGKSTFLAGVVAGAMAVGTAVSRPLPALVASFASAPQQSSPNDQGPPQSQSSASPPHKVKVWTNDDLVATRTPADNYLFAKEAQAAANAAAAMQTVLSCFAFNAEPQPTQEETLKALQDAARSVNDDEAEVAEAQKELREAPDNLKAQDQAELDRRTASLNKAHQQLAVLEDRLRQLTSQSGGEVPTEPAPTQPQ